MRRRGVKKDDDKEGDGDRPPPIAATALLKDEVICVAREIIASCSWSGEEEVWALTSNMLSF